MGERLTSGSQCYPTLFETNIVEIDAYGDPAWLHDKKK